MATVTPSHSGAAVTYQAAVGPDKYDNTGTERLHVRNGGGAPITVQIQKGQLCSYGQQHLTDAADQYVIPNGSDRILPALDPKKYSDGSGFVNFTYTGTASVTVGVIAS